MSSERWLGQGLPLVGDDLVDDLDLPVGELHPRAPVAQLAREDRRRRVASRLRVPGQVVLPDERDALLEVEPVHQVALASMEVDRALVQRPQGARGIGDPEDRPGLLVDDQDRVGARTAQRDACRGRVGAAPGEAGRRAYELAGLLELEGRRVGSRSEHPVVGGREGRLVGRGAQVAEPDLRALRVEHRGLDTAAKQRLGVAREEAVEPVRGGHVEREPLTAPARSSPLLPQARDGAGEADGDRAVEQADVDPELERVGRRHAEELSRHEIALDRTALLGRVARAIGREPERQVRAPGRLERLAGDPEHDLDAAAAAHEADRPQARGRERREQSGRLRERRATLAGLVVEQGRLPEGDGAGCARRAVLRHDGHVETVRAPASSAGFPIVAEASRNVGVDPYSAHTRRSRRRTSATWLPKTPR